MADDNAGDKPTEREIDLVALAAIGVAALASLWLGKKVVSSVGAQQASSPVRRAGEGTYRSSTYGAGFCPDHQCRTTHKDGDEYWCPHCWNMTMMLFYRP